MSLDQIFVAATQYVDEHKATGKFKPTEEDVLSFYGLYNQANKGDCNIPQPWMINVMARAKWEAWTKYKGKTSDAAKDMYIGLAKKYGFRI
jgi:acyl-CoA-binding protein